MAGCGFGPLNLLAFQFSLVVVIDNLLTRYHGSLCNMYYGFRFVDRNHISNFSSRVLTTVLLGER